MKRIRTLWPGLTITAMLLSAVAGCVSGRPGVGTAIRPQYLVGGGWYIIHTARVAGNAYVIDQVTREPLASQSLSPGERIEVSPDEIKGIAEAMRVEISTPPLLYFVPDKTRAGGEAGR